MLARSQALDPRVEDQVAANQKTAQVAWLTDEARGRVAHSTMPENDWHRLAVARYSTMTQYD